jgi:Phosphoinositide phospholipase C, Ca2+-dependent
MRRTARALIGAALMLAACGGGGSDDASSDSSSAVSSVPGTAVTSTIAPTTPPPPTPPSTNEPDRALTIDQMQVIGSHNSFHIRPQQAAFDAITAVSPELAESIDYTHRPLTEQLEMFGIRQFELDVFADPGGGLYSYRAANAVIGLDPVAPEPELQLPGYKVLHTQDFDYETTCLTLVACLSEIEAWSSAHPNHLPVMIMLEVKTQSVPEAAAADGLELTIDLPWTVPLPMTPELFDALDAEIASVFDPEQLITPDDVRGTEATLEAAVLGRGWPTIDDSRGKVLFTLNNTGDLRAMYTAGHPSLEGRPMFTSATPGDPDAAFVRFDDPNSPGLDDAVRAGYLIRTRTDSPTADARANDTTERDLAFASGAQFLSTDYYEPSQYFDSPYVVRLPNGAIARCNPVTSPPTCSDDQLAE